MDVSSRYRFGCFELTPSTRRLTARNVPVELGFRSFEALTALVAARGAVVERDDLHRRLWPDIIVDETSLNKCVSELRKAFAEYDPSHEYVETVRGRGYRMAAQVTLAPPSEAAPRVSRLRMPAVGAVAAVVVLALLASLGWQAWHRRSIRRQVSELRSEADRLYQERDYEQAARATQRAITLEPDNGRLYGELAHTLHRMRGPTIELGQSIELARKGVELEPNCAECQGTLGFFLFYHGWQWNEVREHYGEALRLAPDSVSIRPSLALLLAATGETARAVEQARIAAVERPLQAGFHAALAQALYADRRFEEAIAAADRAIGLERGRKEAWEYRARSQFALGRTADGVRSMIAVRYSAHAEAVGAAVDAGGPEAGLRRLLELTGGWPERSEISWRRAAWLAILGEEDAAITALEEALRLRNINLMFVAVDPLYDALHRRPRFQAIVAEMGLATEAQYRPTLGRNER
ncbi:MAG: winged helix-turn-helix domain-containing protein [Acidobacteria bacterium]|nr:winged helix-turn-helix domain-containing protein [Acidobacteriota bacterium]